MAGSCPDPAESPSEHSRGAVRAGARLQRAPELSVRVHSNNQVRITWEGGEFTGDLSTLAVLAAFRRPHTLADGLRRLASLAGSPEEWAELAHSVTRLRQAGALRDPDSPSPPVLQEPAGFDSPLLHARMLNDHNRTGGYLRAIAEVVRPGDVVVDIGTGTGVLAMAAARAGARRVYAVEGGAMAEVAEAVFAANGLADRITLIRGWSTRVELPEQADVIVSEIMGGELLGERLAETTSDALRRFARGPDGPPVRMIPQRVRLFALPLAVPPEVWMRLDLPDEQVDRWRERYGLDFAPLRVARGDQPHCTWIATDRLAGWSSVCSPVLLATVDLTEPIPGRLDCRVTARAQVSGAVTAVLIYYDAVLSPGETLSLHPERAAGTSWRCPLWTLPCPITLAAGRELRLYYQYPDSLGSGRLVLEGAAVQCPNPPPP